MRCPAPLGMSSFEDLRRAGAVYVDKLRARGATPVVELGVVFDGKQAHVASRVTP